MYWLVHDYREDDLAAVVHLIDTTAELGQESVFSLAECISALTSRQPAVVAVHQGAPIGAALACVAGERAWVMRIAIAPAWRGRGLASSLLRELERRLVACRVRRIAYVLPEEELLGEGLHNAGYTRRPAAAYFEKDEPQAGAASGLLEELGGRLLPGDLWAKVAGMETEKTLIERRVVAPLAEPERAARHGVRPPRAIALFGPPGTGKTTFARAIASRLGWPFVELLPSRLADEGNLAAALRDAFARIGRLERALVFIDEVEEIAPLRTEGVRGGMHGVTNELLKLIPGFREGEERLLVCATNSIRSLDPAFLRPGRFDYLIPIGPRTRPPAPPSGPGTRPAGRTWTSTPWWARASCSPRRTSSTPPGWPPRRPSNGTSRVPTSWVRAPWVRAPPGPPSWEAALPDGTPPTARARPTTWRRSPRPGRPSPRR